MANKHDEEKAEPPTDEASPRERHSSMDEKNTILTLPSARYIRHMEFGGPDPRVPEKWKKNQEHAELYFTFMYEDYLHASG